MNQKTKFTLLILAAVIVLMWGWGMGDGDKDDGYSDETTYYSAAELKERQRVIDEMAKMRGETPAPTATAAPEKEEEKLDARFENIAMQQPANSFTLSAIGYDEQQQILLAEFNMTGLIYAFFDVPEEEWTKLNEAADFDKWFDVMIMKKFSFEQLN